jgi:hypothetical protein
MFRSKKSRGIALGLILTLAIAGAAVAYWTNSGSGSGTATTGDTAADLTFTQTSTISNLRPGGAAQAIEGTITNTGDETVLVTSLSAAIDDTGMTGCDATDYTIAGSPASFSTSIPAGGTYSVTAAAGLTIAFNNKPATNQDGCKGETVNIDYTVG